MFVDISGSPAPGRRLQVLILSCVHPTDDGRVSYRFAQSIMRAGHDVAWVGPDRQTTANRPEGIRWALYMPGRGRLGRLAHWIRALWIARGIGRFDVIYAPELDSAFAALVLRFMGTTTRVIFDVHEMYGGEMVARWSIPGARPAVRHCVLAGLRQLAKRSDLVIGVCEPVLDGLKVPSDRCLIVQNSPPRSFALSQPPGGTNARMVMHGKATRHHGTLAVLAGFANASQAYPDARLLVFDAFFEGEDYYSRDEFFEIVRSLGVEDKILLHPMVPYDEMGAVTAGCGVGVIAYTREWAVGSSPNRLFEYLAAGIPIVGQSYASEVRQILEEHQCGIGVDTEVADEIAAALITIFSEPRMAREMGRRGKDAFLSHLSWEAQFEPVRLWLVSDNRRP